MDGSDNFVSVNTQSWTIFVPIVAIWAYLRIEKLLLGIILHIALSVLVATPLAMILPFPYAYIVTYAIIIPVNIYAIRKWSREWNYKLEKMKERGNNL